MWLKAPRTSTLFATPDRPRHRLIAKVTGRAALLQTVDLVGCGVVQDRGSFTVAPSSWVGLFFESITFSFPAISCVNVPTCARQYLARRQNKSNEYQGPLSNHPSKFVSLSETQLDLRNVSTHSEKFQSKERSVLRAKFRTTGCIIVAWSQLRPSYPETRTEKSTKRRATEI